MGTGTKLRHKTCRTRHRVSRSVLRLRGGKMEADTVVSRMSQANKKEDSMMSIKERDAVLNVIVGHDAQWHVTSEHSLQPLASFDDPQSACAWAIQRVKPVQGRVAVDGIPIAIRFEPDGQFRF
jgi:hypothetical protein